MSTTGISWTQEVWNPTTGCDRITPGCDSCYALGMARRLKAMGQPKYQRDGNPRTSGPGFGIAEHWDVLAAPLSWRKPRRVFVNSMSDLFHRGVSDDFIARVFAVMALTPHITYQVLTKRHARMRNLLSGGDFGGLVDRLAGGIGHDNGIRVADEIKWPLPNVWLGVSAEDQKRADMRVPDLLGTPAAVRWVSAEPLIGPIDFRFLPFPRWSMPQRMVRKDMVIDAVGARYGVPDRWQAPAVGLDWVVCGGESGHGARPMGESWAWALREQCLIAGVPFFFKQAGSVLAKEWRCKGAGDDPEEWPEEWPQQYPVVVQ